MSSTSPVQVVSDTEIQHLGKTDMVTSSTRCRRCSEPGDRFRTPRTRCRRRRVDDVNLRGLGRSARWCSSTAAVGTADANTGNLNPAPNLDQIPVALIERVDVVTGGASRGLRSDAIAGVVNFISARILEAQIDAQRLQSARGTTTAAGLASDAALRSPTAA
jgi:outer membrane receptor protein involved in Fe transport